MMAMVDLCHEFCAMKICGSDPKTNASSDDRRSLDGLPDEMIRLPSQKLSFRCGRIIKLFHTTSNSDPLVCGSPMAKSKEKYRNRIRGRVRVVIKHDE